MVNVQNTTNLKLTGEAISMIAGIICMIFTFLPGISLGGWRILLFIFGAFFIRLGLSN